MSILHAWLCGRLELATGRFEAAISWFAVLDMTTQSTALQYQIQKASLLMASASDSGDIEASSSNAPSKAPSAADFTALTPATSVAAAADAAVAALGSSMPTLCSDAEVTFSCYLHFFL